MKINTHSSPFFFLSAAFSRCLCSIACLCFVASLYSFANSRLVTFSHSFRLSNACWCSSGRTRFGTTSSVDRSRSVAGSSAVGAPAPARRHRTRDRHDPSKNATAHDSGTCLTFVHSRCAVSPSRYVWMMPSMANFGELSQDY